MDNIEIANKIEYIFNENLEDISKSSFKEFIILNKDVIINICKYGSLAEGIDLLSGMILKLPANCKLQQELIKIIKEILKNDKE